MRGTADNGQLDCFLFPLFDEAGNVLGRALGCLQGLTGGARDNSLQDRQRPASSVQRPGPAFSEARGVVCAVQKC